MNPRTSVLFFSMLLPQISHADEPVQRAPSSQLRAQQTVDRAIVYLQTESASWQKTRKCAACHHLPMPLWAMNEAEKQGYVIDKKFVSDSFDSVMGSAQNLIATKVISGPKDPPDPRLEGKGLNIGVAFLSITAQSMPSLTKGQKESVNLLLEEITRRQQPNGSWLNVDNRAPILESYSTDAMWVIMALQSEVANVSTERQESLRKAITWLRETKLPDTHQGKLFSILLNLRTGSTRKDVQPQIDELLSMQQSDGGWRQTSQMNSDAYATGQSLYVLSVAGYKIDSPEVRRAINFLADSQKPDGSWLMVARRKPDDQPAKLLTPITCAASSWAVIGLAKFVPKNESK
jgi:Squalene-hopene cyclase C-terminal domain